MIRAGLDGPSFKFQIRKFETAEPPERDSVFRFLWSNAWFTKSCNRLSNGTKEGTTPDLGELVFRPCLLCLVLLTWIFWTFHCRASDQHHGGETGQGYISAFANAWFFTDLLLFDTGLGGILIQKACSCALVHKTLSVYIRELWFLKSKKSTCHDLLLQVRACSDSATLSGLAAVVVTKSAHFSIRFFPSAILTCSRVQAIIIASVIHQFIAGMFGIVWFLNQIIKLNLKPCRSEFLVSGSHPCWGTGQLPPIPAAA